MTRWETGRVRYHAVTCTDDECCSSCPIGDPTRLGGTEPRWEFDPNTFHFWIFNSNNDVVAEWGLDSG